MKRGMSLVELLLGLSILTLVMTISYRAMLMIVRIQGDQEAVTITQSKLRRTLEVISQDVRGAVFGGILSQPYTSGSSAFSMALLTGGAGYPVLPYANSTSTSISFIAQDPTAEFANGGYSFLVAKNAGVLNGVLLPITATPTGTSPTWNATLGCGVTLPFSADSPPLLFHTDAVGYRFDAAAKTLYYRQLGQTAEQAVAYDITQFVVDYVYQSDSGSFSTNPSGYNSSGKIALKLAGNTLDRLRITISAEEPSMGKKIKRTLSSEIELINNLTMPLEGTVNCT